MATYKLTYFPSRGRAETIRFVFEQAGVKYEDERISGEDWLKFKPNTPYGSLPVLEVDGKMLAGSGVIVRFLAERFELAGTNDFENAEIASIVDTGHDLGLKMVAVHLEKDEARKAELQTELATVTSPKFLGIFDKLIAANGSGWLYGNKVTYVDLSLYTLLSFLLVMIPTVLDDHPNVKKNMDSVAALPRIAEWLDKRPKLNF